MAVSARIGSKSNESISTLQTPIDLTKWVTVDEDALPEAQRNLFLRRKQGIRLYLDGASAETVKSWLFVVSCGI